MLYSNESDEILFTTIRDSKKRILEGSSDLCLLNVLLMEYACCLFID
jgi:hypothetical protein